MRKRVYKILVTGGAGFMGSAFVRSAVKKGYRIVVVDKLTYAGDLKRLEAVKGAYIFYKADICNKKRLLEIFNKEKPDRIVHFAAETHVDRSIKNSEPFIETNVTGTQVLLDIAREKGVSKFVHISTDEVYGDIKKGKFSEDSPLLPNSPYAASKAAADLLIRSYIKTYDFPAIIVRPCNNYGPWQYPEKFIPVIIYKAYRGEKVPIYGKGLNIREWLYVRDCVEAISLILEKAVAGGVYNIGSGHEERNIDLARKVLKIFNRRSALIELVKDRPGHDYRYSLDSSKTRNLGWRPKMSFSSGLKETTQWYRQNINWLEEKAAYLTNYWKKIYIKA